MFYGQKNARYEAQIDYYQFNWSDLIVAAQALTPTGRLQIFAIFSESPTFSILTEQSRDNVNRCAYVQKLQR